MRNQKGFTMIELLIVGVILAVMATLAMPAFKTSQEAALRQEAVASLMAVRDAEQRYFMINGKYADTFAKLDFDPTGAAVGGDVKHYTYAAPTSSDSFVAAWKCKATRNGVGGALNSTATVEIDQAGALVNG